MFQNRSHCNYSLARQRPTVDPSHIPHREWGPHSWATAEDAEEKVCSLALHFPSRSATTAISHSYCKARPRKGPLQRHPKQALTVTGDGLASTRSGKDHLLPWKKELEKPDEDSAISPQREASFCLGPFLSFSGSGREVQCQWQCS